MPSGFVYYLAVVLVFACSIDSEGTLGTALSLAKCHRHLRNVAAAHAFP